MWAEAWIGPDEWVPMDAALDGFDVGHIAITKSALEEVNPVVDLNTPVLQLMQSLKIEVVQTVSKADMPPRARPAPPQVVLMPSAIVPMPSGESVVAPSLPETSIASPPVPPPERRPEPPPD
jgi:hypothetical protein